MVLAIFKYFSDSSNLPIPINVIAYIEHISSKGSSIPNFLMEFISPKYTSYNVSSRGFAK